MITSQVASSPFDTRVWELREEFLTLGQDGDLWNTTLDSSSTATILQAGGGGLQLLATVDNDNAQISSTNEIASFESDGLFEFEATIKADLNADGLGAFFVGLADDDATDFIVDGGANVKTTFDGVGFFVADGGSVFQTVYSNGATQDIDTDVSNNEGVSDGAFADETIYVLRISARTQTDGIYIRMYINGEQVKEYTAKTLTGADPMHLMASLKAGSANDQKLEVHRIYYKQWRA